MVALRSSEGGSRGRASSRSIDSASEEKTMTSKMIAVPGRGGAGLLCLISLFALASVTGCGDSDVTSIDQPPTVSVLSPDPGEDVSPVGFVVRANATDDRAVQRVEILIDEQLYAIIIDAPYEIYVATIGLVPGMHSLHVRAVDDEEQAREAVVSVSVQEKTYRRLTGPEPGFKHFEPAWHPQGVEIAYSRQGVAPNATKNIYVIPAGETEGTGQRVTDGLQQDGNAAYAPDGLWLAFESNRTGYYQIYITNLAKADTFALTSIGSANQRRPTWTRASGTGFESWVAYDSDRYPGGGARRDIYMILVSTQGDSIRIVDPTNQPDLPADTNEFDDLAPQWSTYGFLFVNSSRSGTYAATVLDPFLGGLARLVNGTTQFLVEDHAPTLSPFDAYVAFAETTTGTEKTFVVPTGGNGEIRWEVAPGGNVFPDGSGFPDATDAAWSPTGEKIAFVSTKTGTEEIWILE
jgi:Tol biopolymer transport system component